MPGIPTWATSCTRRSAGPIRMRSRRASPSTAPVRPQRGARSTRSSGGVPYLPIDPADIGRDYDAVIRVNSQSWQGRHRLPAGDRVRRRTAPGACRSTSPATCSATRMRTGGGDHGRRAVGRVREHVHPPGRRCRRAHRVRHRRRAPGAPTPPITLRIDGHAHVTDHTRGRPGSRPSPLHSTPTASASMWSACIRRASASGNDSDALTLLEHRSSGGDRWMAGRGRSCWRPPCRP